MAGDLDRFPFYRSLTARRAEQASCGHAVQVGEVIGWNAKLKRAKCRECWARWVAENDAADFDERSGGAW